MPSAGLHSRSRLVLYFLHCNKPTYTIPSLPRKLWTAESWIAYSAVRHWRAVLVFQVHLHEVFNMRFFSSKKSTRYPDSSAKFFSNTKSNSPRYFIYSSFWSILDPFERFWVYFSEFCLFNFAQDGHVCLR